MRGPILKMMSLMESSLSESPHTSTMARSPMLGFVLRQRNPWQASMRFSPMIGTMSDAMLTAQRSSRLESLLNSMPLLVANACMNLNPTPQPERWV